VDKTAQDAGLAGKQSLYQPFLARISARVTSRLHQEQSELHNPSYRSLFKVKEQQRDGWVAWPEVGKQSQRYIRLPTLDRMSGSCQRTPSVRLDTGRLENVLKVDSTRHGNAVSRLCAITKIV
jgi:hypothetical protein